MSTVEVTLLMIILIPVFIFAVLFTMDSIIPFFVFNELSAICNEYNQILIKEGVLSAAETNEFKTKLENRGLKNVTMSLPTSLEWGDSFVIEVSGNVDFQRISINLSKYIRSVEFNYQRNGTALKGGD